MQDDFMNDLTISQLGRSKHIPITSVLYEGVNADIANRLTLAIDFDGTVVEDNYPDIGQLRKDADLVMRRLHAHGHVIIMNSNREGQHKEEAIRFLNDNKIPFHYFNENDPRLINKYDNDSRKIGADIYIDDKSLFYKGQSWVNIFNEILKIATE